MTFTPVETFFSDDFKSVYCAGLTYTVRADNAKLRGAVEQWLKDGKVRLVSGNFAIAAGAGEVK